MHPTRAKKNGRLTRILSIFRTNVLVARIQDILIHQSRPRRHLSEEADLHWLSNLDPLSLLHKDLPGILASIFAVQTWYTILFRVMALFEGLQGRHEVVAASYAGSDDALSDTGCDSAFDDGSDGVHRADYFRLELWGYVKFDLLEKVFGSAEATDDKDVLRATQLAQGLQRAVLRKFLPGGFCFELEWL